MVNTFVTSDSVVECAKNLDRLRLGKQRVEAYQLWRALMGMTKGWTKHPATLMWTGHTCFLALYCNTMIDEWVARGYKNTMSHLPRCKNPRPPWWWGWEPLMMSHRASLNRKCQRTIRLTLVNTQTGDTSGRRKYQRNFVPNHHPSNRCVLTWCNPPSCFRCALYA
jgi:hypothetical protein